MSHLPTSKYMTLTFDSISLILHFPYKKVYFKIPREIENMLKKLRNVIEKVLQHFNNYLYEKR